MHAHASSVSFPCVDLKNKGGPESSMNQIEANESSRFYFCMITIITKNILIKIKPIVNGKSD